MQNRNDTACWRDAMKVAIHLAALALAAAPPGALAEWPAKAIHVIVPFMAGSGTDLVARTVLEPVARALKQPVIIENKPGAGGTLGAAQVARSAPDGYTLLVRSAGQVASPALYGDPGHRTVEEFAGVTSLASLPNVLVVSPRKGFKSPRDLVAAAKASPGKVSYASAGNGSGSHVNAEIFRRSAGIEAQHIALKGAAEAIDEVARGHIDFFFAPLVSALPSIKDGRVLALAVGTPKRSPLAPDLPTTVESGYPDSGYVAWVALLAPSATPRAVIDRLNAEAVKALVTPEVKRKLAGIGAEPMPMKPVQLDAFLEREAARVGAVVKPAGLKAN